MALIRASKASKVITGISCFTCPASTPTTITGAKAGDLVTVSWNRSTIAGSTITAAMTSTDFDVLDSVAQPSGYQSEGILVGLLKAKVDDPSITSNAGYNGVLALLD